MTKKPRKLDVCATFANGAREILAAREQGGQIHGTSDIRAAGNEVEVAVREYVARTLPSKFHVTHGHLIDRVGAVSPQLDIIVSDNALLPALMRARDGTEYVPFDSTYAFGEVKATYRDSDQPIQKFSSIVHHIKNELLRPEIPNTAFGGDNKGDALLFDMVHGSPNRIRNPLFTFMLFVDAGDFDGAKVTEFFAATGDEALPNVIVFLNAGVIFAGTINEGGQVLINRYPEYHPEKGTSWHFSEIPGPAVSLPEGNHLAFLYYNLILHLAECQIDNSFSSKYFNPVLAFRRSTMEILRKSEQEDGQGR